MKLIVKKLDWEFVVTYQDVFPDYTYSQEFVSFQKSRVNCERHYIGVYENDNLLVILPLDIVNEVEAYCVYKDYAYPLTLMNGEINWKKLTKIIREQFKFKYCKLHVARVSNGRRGPLSNFILDIDGILNRDDIWKNYQRKTRNEIKKAMSYNFTTEIVGSEGLDNFYNLYVENMRRHRTPIRDKQYFVNMFDCFRSKCCLIVMYDGPELIGANLLIMNKDYLRLVFNVSKVEYWKMCVNNLLYHQTVLFAQQQGIVNIDFGPGVTSDYSHNKFKLGFGAKQEFLSEFVCGKISYIIKFWLEHKVYNLKLRLNKYVRTTK